MIEYDFEIKKLSNQFYLDYPENKYPEILQKGARCYNCVIFQTKYDYYVCIPFRTNMNHSNGYHFTNSIRSKQHKSGLDYSKMVIINDNIYFENAPGTIDSDEYVEMLHNIKIIITNAYDYLDNYINFKNKIIYMHPNKYSRLYKYTTLKYFENIIL